MLKANAKRAQYFLTHLSPKRIANSGRLIAGFQYSRFRKQPSQWALPISIAIEPTTACNLGCPECPSGLKKFTRPTGNTQIETVEKVLHEIGDTLQYLTYYFQGEPFIHSKLIDMVALASDRGIYTATSTNGHFMGEKLADQIVKSGLNELIISLDGTTQEVYEQYRIHGKLNKVLDSTREIVDAKRRAGSIFPLIYFQFLVVRPNEHQIEDVKKLAAKMGVDGVKFKTAQVYEFENGNELIPTIERYSRYEQGADGRWSIKNSLENQCWKMWQSCVMTWDGRVVPCCFDKDATHEMGNLSHQSFRDIWWGESYQAFRSALLRSRQEIDICKNCSEGTKVWA